MYIEKKLLLVCKDMVYAFARFSIQMNGLAEVRASVFTGWKRVTPIESRSTGGPVLRMVIGIINM